MMKRLRAFLARHGYKLAVTVGFSLVAVGSWHVYREASRDRVAESRAAIEAGRPAEARAVLSLYLEDPEEGREDEARYLLALAIYEENASRDTLTEFALDDSRDQLLRAESGEARDLFGLAWKLVEGYRDAGAHEKRLALLEEIDRRFPNRAEVHLERAAALVDLSPVARREDARAEIDLYLKLASESDARRVAAFARAEVERFAAAYFSERALAQERYASVGSFRSDVENAISREKALREDLEAYLAEVPEADRLRSWPQRARLEEAESYTREVDLLGKLSARIASETPSDEDWAGRVVAARDAARALAEVVAGQGETDPGDLSRARFLFADLLRREGRFEEAAKLYAELAEKGMGDERAVVGLLAALLGRARIGVDLAGAKETGEGWKEVEELLARFEEGAGIRPELLAEGGAVYEELSRRRIGWLEAMLAEYARRVGGARPELLAKRRAEVEAEVVRLRERYARSAADLYWSAARHTGRHALRIDAAWRAAENYRLFGQVAAEALALEDFVARADDDPRNTAALYHLGRAYERRGFLENAVVAHRTNTDLFPSTPFSYRSRYELGRMAEEAGDLEGALARYSSIRNDPSAEFDPDSRVWRDALFRLAALNERLDDRGVEGGAARAEELYGEAVERYPSDPRIGFAHYRLALLADRKDRYADAARHYALATLSLSTQAGPAGERPESGQGPAGVLRACRYAHADLLYRQALAAPASERGSGLDLALSAYKDAVFRHPGGYEEAWAHYQMGQAYRLLDKTDWSERFLAQSMNLLAKVEGGTAPGAFDPSYWKRILEWAKAKELR